MPDFFPRKETDLLSWGANFISKLPPMVERFGISQQLVDDCIAAHGRFRDAMRLRNDPGTATRPVTSMKNVAMAEFKKAARSAAGVLRSQPLITDADLIQLGLRPHRSKRRSRVPAPTMPPSMNVRHTGEGMIEVMVFDRAHLWRRARPANAVGMLILCHLGEQPPQHGWSVLKATGRTRMRLALPAVEPGTRIWISACWLGTRAQRSPTAPPVSLIAHERPLRFATSPRMAA